MRTWKSLCPSLSCSPSLSLSLSVSVSHPPLHFLFLSSYSVSPLPSLLYHFIILPHLDYLHLLHFTLQNESTVPIEIICNIFNNSFDIGQSSVQHCPAGKNIISTHMFFITPFIFNNRSYVSF